MRAIREATNDGEDIAEFMLAVFAGKHRAGLAARMKAADWLADRGFGRPVQPHMVSADEAHQEKVDHGALMLEAMLAVVRLYVTDDRQFEAIMGALKALSVGDPAALPAAITNRAEN